MDDTATAEKTLKVVDGDKGKVPDMDGPIEPVADKPNRAEAEEAVRILIKWAGDDPDREGLTDTPSRVVRSYEEFFDGYGTCPKTILQRTFKETDGYDEIVLLRNIRFESHCEHHMAPIIGRVHIAYLPHHRIVGISKLARLVQVFAKRLQIQEKLTAQIANTIDEVLEPKGVAVVVEAAHQCMTTRGINKPGTLMVTSRMLGALEEWFEGVEAERRRIQPDGSIVELVD